MTRRSFPDPIPARTALRDDRTDQDMVFAEDGQPVVRPGMTITATPDHRFVDGFQAATLAAQVRKYFAHPELFEGQNT